MEFYGKWVGDTDVSGYEGCYARQGIIMEAHMVMRQIADVSIP